MPFAPDAAFADGAAEPADGAEVGKENENPEEEERKELQVDDLDLDLDTFGKKKKKGKKKPFVMDDVETALPEVEAEAPEEPMEEQEVNFSPSHPPQSFRMRPSPVRPLGTPPKNQQLAGPS